MIMAAAKERALRAHSEPVILPDEEGKAPLVYQVYGLRFSSDLPLACPQDTQSGRADVELVTASGSLVPAAVRPNRDDWFHHVPVKNGSTYLQWPRLGEFLISPDGRLISCRALNGVSGETFQTYLLTQALSCALVKQGIEPLHATAVVVNGEAIAFLGNCGYGKSSLGAAFLRAGHPLLTDDLLVISQTDPPTSPLVAHPGPARIKLFPEIAERLLDARRTGLQMNPDTNKLILPLSESEHCAVAVPLKTIYVLRPPAAGRSNQPVSVRTLPSRRVCIELIANTFNLIITDPARLRRQFEWAARVAAVVPVKSLSYPRNLAQVNRVVTAVREDLSR